MNNKFNETYLKIIKECNENKLIEEWDIAAGFKKLGKKLKRNLDVGNIFHGKKTQEKYKNKFNDLVKNVFTNSDFTPGTKNPNAFFKTVEGKRIEFLYSSADKALKVFVKGKDGKFKLLAKKELSVDASEEEVINAAIDLGQKGKLPDLQFKEASTKKQEDDEAAADAEGAEGGDPEDDGDSDDGDDGSES